MRKEPFAEDQPGPPGPVGRWNAFLGAFFQPPNQLVPGGGVVELDGTIADAERLLAAEPPGPVILPAKLTTGTRYFAIAFDADQARALRELLRSYLGDTWTDFDGESVAKLAELDQFDVAAISLSGGVPEQVFRLEVADDARALARRQVRALMRSLVDRPPRQAHLAQPIGRTLGDFADACAIGAEQAAFAAFDQLTSDHRISAANQLFLRIELLATFERWAELDDVVGIGEVLHLTRPAMTSDALARFAMARLSSPPNLTAFEEDIAPRFGALVESISAIRSAVGARYYALWALMGGEAPFSVAERLGGTPWAEDPILLALLSQPSRESVETEVATEDEIRRRAIDAVDGGRCDTAVELFARLAPSAADLAAVVTAVRGDPDSFRHRPSRAIPEIPGRPDHRRRSQGPGPRDCGLPPSDNTAHVGAARRGALLFRRGRSARPGSPGGARSSTDQ